jgi:hypothetical protein
MIEREYHGDSPRKRQLCRSQESDGPSTSFPNTMSQRHYLAPVNWTLLILGTRASDILPRRTGRA